MNDIYRAPHQTEPRLPVFPEEDLQSFIEKYRAEFESIIDFMDLSSLRGGYSVAVVQGESQGALFGASLQTEVQKKLDVGTTFFYPKDSRETTDFRAGMSQWGEGVHVVDLSNMPYSSQDEQKPVDSFLSYINIMRSTFVASAGYKMLVMTSDMYEAFAQCADLWSCRGYVARFDSVDSNPDAS
ncbi:MAG: hypothetical protein WAQ24_05370 [Candidatus Saccharimonadales bacterium]